ncbi:hypothetical protein A2U01_0013667, partial [Trifolium medium]|nr:hypothetical protein [Trifolium medium]
MGFFDVEAIFAEERVGRVEEGPGVYEGVEALTGISSVPEGLEGLYVEGRCEFDEGVEEGAEGLYGEGRSEVDEIRIVEVE